MFEYIGHLRIIQGIELEKRVRTISLIALGSNFGSEVQKDVDDMQKEIARLLEFEPERVELRARVNGLSSSSIFAYIAPVSLAISQ